ncbi:hypothetical protein DV736_g1087, partial [Chaetothyriales sp. CBS 134916]
MLFFVLYDHTDILHLIINYLHPVDRVCLGLTCKALCAAVLSAPALTHPGWMRFAQPNFTHRSLSHLRFPRIYASMPEVRTLVLRLAHGWIDKSRYLYCWKCHRILARNEKMWRDRLPESVANQILLGLNIHVRLNWFNGYNSCSPLVSEPADDTLPATPDHGHRAPAWSLKTLTDKATWNVWTRTQRYDHLVKIWCYSHTEDTSFLSCDFCATGTGTTELLGILDGANGSVLLERRSQTETVHPVECPTCLKKELISRSKRRGVYEAWRLGRRSRRDSWTRFIKAVRDIVD